MIKNTLTKVSVGVDISKDFLDIHIHPVDEKLRVNNDASGYEKILKTLSKFDVHQIVCESSGGYERRIMNRLRQSGHKTWILDPRRIKAFRNAKGCRAKTDLIDAKMIAMFAHQEHPDYPQKPLTEIELTAQALTGHRIDLTVSIANEKKRLQQTEDQYCIKSIKRIIRALEHELQKIDIKMTNLIDHQQSLQKKVVIMQSMPGVGKIVAQSIVSLMPELGACGDKQIGSLLGVVPYAKQSGKYVGRSVIGGGRSKARNIMYMAALSASRSHSKLGDFYKKLRAHGKKAKVALVALMRKMIVILNIMLRKEILWAC